MSALDERLRELRRLGYKRTSNKYRTVARLPSGMTGLQALRNVDPGMASDLTQRIDDQAADRYRRVFARANGNALELDEETFEAFKRSGGESSW